MAAELPRIPFAELQGLVPLSSTKRHVVYTAEWQGRPVAVKAPALTLPTTSFNREVGSGSTCLGP